MQKLLWLTENYPPQRGGMAQSCDRIISGMRGVGFTIEIIHFVHQGKSLRRQQQQHGGYTAIEFEDSESHTLNLTWNYIKGLGSFDCLICFGGYLSMIGAPIFAKWGNIKLVTFLRGNDFDTAIFTPRKRIVLEDALKQSDLVFTVSKDKIDKIQKWIPGTEVHYVPNGIDIHNWNPTKSEVDFVSTWKTNNAGDKICLGLFGQLKPKKGSKFLIEALSKTSLLDQMHLLLIGDVEPDFTEQLNGLDISYSQLSFLDRYELMKYFLCCDALLIPSFYDGMPNVMLEAGALGIPVIASAADGMIDVIDHGKSGLLFYPGNTDDCRKAFYHFFSISEDERRKLGENLKTEINNHYNLENEIHEYKRLLT